MKTPVSDKKTQHINNVHALPPGHDSSGVERNTVQRKRHNKPSPQGDWTSLAGGMTTLATIVPLSQKIQEGMCPQIHSHTHKHHVAADILL